MNVLENFLAADSSDDNEFEQELELGVRSIRRNLRDTSNPLLLEESIFKQRFRLSKQAFQFVEQKLRLSWGKTRASIPPILKLCLALEVLSSGNYQSGVGNDFLIGMAQSTVSSVFSETLEIMERTLCYEFIKFEPSQNTKEKFYHKFNFPGIVGCVDGTHIYHLKPNENEHSFLNRKGRHSLNAMVICDDSMKIMAVNATYGGSNHDSFVWANSVERVYMERYFEENPNSFLLGDSGYPLEPWMMTAYRSIVENSAEANFNKVHSKARCIVENCIGVWKGRWRIIMSERQCRYAPEKIVQICNVTAALHNICLKFRISATDINIIPENESILALSEIHNASSNRLRTIAQQTRDRIRDSLIH